LGREAWQDVLVKHRIRQVVRGTTALAAMQIVANIAAFVMAWSVARGMGEANYGVFATAYALATSVAALADSGIRMTLIREVANEPRAWLQLLRYALLISGMLAVLVAIGFLAMILVKETIYGQQLRLWLLAYALIWTGFRIILGVLAGHNRLVAVGIWGAGERLAGAGLVAAWAFSGSASLIYIAESLVALETMLFVSLLLWLFAQPWPREKTAISMLRFGRIALPFGISAAMYAVVGRMDLVVLGFQQVPQTAAYYAVGQVLPFFMLFAVIALASAMFPSLTQLARDEQHDSTRDLLMPAMGISVLLILTSGGVLIAGAPLWLGWIYGESYVQGAVWLALFALTAVFPGLGSLLGAVIAAWGWQGRWAKRVSLVTIVAIPAFWVLGSKLGPWGVALVSVGVQVFLTLTAWRWLTQAGLTDRAWFMKVLAIQALLGVCIWIAGVGHPALWLLPLLAPVLVLLTGVCRPAWVKRAFNELFSRQWTKDVS